MSQRDRRRAGRVGLTVWVDDQHIRRLRSEEHGSRGDMSISVVRTLELWNFGVSFGSLDWSRLPSLRAPG